MASCTPLTLCEERALANDEVAAAQFGREDFAHAGQEHGPLHRAVEQQRRGEPVVAQGGDEGDCASVAVRHAAKASLRARGSPVKSRHLGVEAGFRNKAVYLWSKDGDGNLDDLSDTELYYRVYDASTGIWSAETRYTNDAAPDKNAKVAVDSSGGVYAVWQRSNDLVMDRNFLGAPAAVRADSTTMGFADFALTLGPGGNVLALWQEMSAAGSDAPAELAVELNAPTLRRSDAHMLGRTMRCVHEFLGGMRLRVRERRGKFDFFFGTLHGASDHRWKPESSRTRNSSAFTRAARARGRWRAPSA